MLLVVVWAATGPLFGFSDTWQLFINTTTTVVTFWMVFVIQNSANREAKATQLKLDELIRAVGDARDDFVLVERESADGPRPVARRSSRGRRRRSPPA